MKKNLSFLILVACFLAFSVSGQNTNFELTTPGTYTGSSAVSGWTLSSQTITSCATNTTWVGGSSEFSIIATPVLSLPNIGTLPNSPLGGTTIARLNNSIANGSSTKLTTTIAVTSTNVLLCYAFAGLWESGSHQCCEQASFKIIAKASNGSTLVCQTQSVVTPGCNSVSSFSSSSGTYWTNWQTKFIDLTPHIGTTISLEITNSDCTLGDHYGSLFLDIANPSSMPYGVPTIDLNSPNIFQMSFCTGGNMAVLNAPVGYMSYYWTAPPGYPISAAQSTLSTLTLTNALAGNIYSLSIVAPNGCSFDGAIALVHSTIIIAGIGASPSCSLGTSGSATVVGSGSGTGYLYTWLNSGSSVVSTTNTANNLSAGVYSVIISAAGSQSATCGFSSFTVNVGVAPPGVIQLLRAYCGSEAYLSAPGGNTGGGYQWYNSSLAPISGSLGGNSYSITVTSPSSNSNYYVKYLSAQGCQDSLKFTLILTPSGSLSIVSNPSVCPGATNAIVGLQMTPAPGSPSGLNSYSVFSTGTTSPYSASLSPTSANTFTAFSLSAGSVYSVIAFDGLCKYITSFTVPQNIFTYTLTPLISPTLCPGWSAPLAVNFSSPPSITQYSYSWTPSTFLFGTNSQNSIVTPIIPAGSVTTIIYSVVVTSSVSNCSVTKTLAVTAANLVTPTINPVPALCANAPLYLPSANPGGGTFSGNAGTFSNGSISPGTSALGVNTFSYAISVGTCVAKTTSTYLVNSPPVLTASGNTAICNGQSTSLLAGGATTYSWSNGVSGPLISVSPTTTSSYTLSGTDLSTNCSNTKNITVAVLPSPVLTILGDTLICPGKSTSLSATGANSYSWSTGSSSQNILVSPVTNTTYTLVGTSVMGCSATTGITVKVFACTGLENKTYAGNLSIYPNPSAGKFLLETNTEIKIVLSDASGKTVFEKRLGTGSHELDLSQHANGIYFLKVNDVHETKIIKLVKNN